MSVRLFSHKLSQMLVPSGSDQVLSGIQLPSESSLNNVWGEVHIVAPTPIEFDKAVMYGVDGHVFLHQTPDDGATFNTLWDSNVPKDTDVASGAIDLNASATTINFFEPGEPNVHALADMAIYNDDNNWFKRRKLLSFASSPTGWLPGTPNLYVPSDVFAVRSRRRIGVDYWSLAALGMSSPAFDDVTTTVYTTFGDEAPLMQMKYIEVTLEQAWMQLVGLTETGAETPWEDAATMIGDFLEPTVLEVTAGDFATMGFNVYTKCTWEITVPGRRNFKSISAE